MSMGIAISCPGALDTWLSWPSPRTMTQHWSNGISRTLPIIPQEFKTVIQASTEKQFKIIQSLMHRTDVKEVIAATDAGREGELIFRLVYEQAMCKKPVKRLWISSLESSAIREGWST